METNRNKVKVEYKELNRDDKSKKYRMMNIIIII